MSKSEDKLLLEMPSPGGRASTRATPELPPPPTLDLNTLFKFVKPYDGSRETINSFIVNCNNAYDLAQGNQKQILFKYIVSQLQGKAEVACSIKEFSSWEQLKEFLRTQFSERKHYAHLLTELQESKQGPTDNVSQFALKVETHLSQLLVEISAVTGADFAPIPPQSPCDKPNKNILVEHFFNTIFSEFYSSPPVCVCVQMCPGQSTYCYPNGCFKPATSLNTGPAIRNVAEAKIPPTVISAPLPVVQRDKNNFMLVKDERDFMADFLEQNYVDELKDSASTHNPVEDLLPDVFKSKYNIVSRYRKMSTVDLRHNLQDKVKKELVKSEGEWTKTRWPLSRQNKRSGPTLFSHIEKPMRKQGTYFASMIRDNDVPDYSGKYFKRELTKIADDEDKKLKSSYNLDSLVNMTESKIFSLDKLIENLIKSGATGNVETTTIIEISKREETDQSTEPAIKEIPYTSTTPLSNETTRVISINQTDENIDKNKYVEISLANDAANLTAMIKRLSNQIEIQNNTSMEIAKRTVKSFDTQWYDVQSNTDYKENQMVERSLEDIEMKTVPATSNSEENTTTEAVVTVKSTVETVPEKTTTSSLKLTSPQEKRVTRKNRQKVVKKSGSSKIN